ncbi:MAG: alpha/beta hydrolase, partial [Rhodocyclaceae bacterium]
MHHLLCACALFVVAHLAHAASESPIRLDTAAGAIEGTLTLPATPGTPPLALLIGGSGPTDRDGNSALVQGRNDSLRMLAQALAAAGIASVRYDKRGVAASLPAGRDEAALRFDDYVGDATGWVRRLAADPRFGGVTVIGHSEGALIGLLAAGQSPAAAVVTIAGAGERASIALRRQLH